jgi:hypothetical protein
LLHDGARRLAAAERRPIGPLLHCGGTASMTSMTAPEYITLDNGSYVKLPAKC